MDRKSDTLFIDKVKRFWEENPLSTALIEADAGSPEFFERYDLLRERNEPRLFAKALHEFDRFQGRRVLEVGCGNAYTLARYAEKGAQIYGIDLTEAAIKIARKRFAYRTLKGDFTVGDAEKLPYKTESFDCVCSMGVLHHVPDPEKAVAEIYRCLKPGGRLIVMFYHRDSFLYRVVMPVKSLLTRKTLQQLVNEVDGVGNPKGQVYSRKELTHILADFRDLEIFAGLVQPSVLRRLLPSWINESLGKRWGWFLYAKARK